MTPADPAVEAEQARDVGNRAAARMADRAPTLAEVRRHAARVSVGVGVLVLAVAVILSLLASQDTAEVSGRLAASEQARAEQDAANRTRYDEAIRQAEDANRRLTEQGLPQVPIDRTNPSSAVVGASTANVLGSLTAAERGSPEPIARAIADTVRNGPPVQANDIAGAVAGYLAANPAARGERGEAGPSGEPGAPGTNGVDGQDGANGAPGPPPTQGEIEAAFADAVRSDPQLLCAGQGGEFVLVRGLQLADGRTLDTWTCAAGFGQGEPDPDPPPPSTVTETPDPPPASSDPPAPTPGDTADPQPSSTFEDGSDTGG